MKDTGLAKGSGEAMRLIKQGGVKVNDVTVNDPDAHLQQGEHIIKVGKRRFYKVIVK
jgi:tyrosyl-tRNA synthetase